MKNVEQNTYTAQEAVDIGYSKIKISSPIVSILQSKVSHKKASVSSETSSGGRKRKKLWLENNCCFYCEKELKLEETTLDHYIPRSKGGNSNLKNLRLSCVKCNRKKGDKMPSEKIDYEKIILSLEKSLKSMQKEINLLKSFLFERNH